MKRTNSHLHLDFKKANNMSKRKKVRLTKLSDDHFEGRHPNNINAGHVEEGWMTREPEIGERFYVGFFSTSPVIRLLDKDGIFKTTYSTYKLEII